MKKTNFVLFIVFFLVFYLFLLIPANATSIATSEAKIYWSSLNITVPNNASIELSEIGGTYGVTTTFFTDSTDIDYKYVHSNDWGDLHSLSEFINSNGKNTAEFTATSSILVTDTYSMSNSGGNYASDAYAYRWGYYYAEGSGTANISINYELSQQLYESIARPYETTTAYSLVSLAIFDITSGSNANTGWHGLWTPTWNPPLNGIITETGALSLSMEFNNNDRILIQAGLLSPCEADSRPIPEPSSILLLSSGGLALIYYLKKRQRFRPTDRF
jgi:hypothetical protein